MSEATTSTTTGGIVGTSPESFLRAMREAGLLDPAPSDWALIAPDGRVYKGRPEQLLPVLAQHHPFLANSLLAR